MSLQLVNTPDTTEAPANELTVCKDCNGQMRPDGTSEVQYPGTLPSWGENQCRVCDYQTCGKDPDDRFIPVRQVSYLASLRAGIETERRRRNVPAVGTRAGRIPITEFLEQIS
ncbi:hypothetical protein IV500_06075 [Paeniglutamicibacter antarcticus]|uniref:Uncharacterized protein n=1 Tax=Arthrobacter terrae TaxID=2935737 RepID=A0A931CM40_9MICC|nr:hypothetical protein [Arthrobacter terrae]MBG0738990.1 hypothetical protein [Arthrobacter terrae]